MADEFERLTAARARLANRVVETPLISWGRGLWLKCENAQITGSFKLRGALNKVLTLDREQRQRGIVTASAGNHGQGVALAGKLAGIRVTVVVPDDAVRKKVDAIRRLGAEVIEVAGGYGAAEPFARKLAEKERALWISPYNDLEVIAGQGTIGLEILDQHPTPADVYVPVSGGGLAGGIGLALAAAGAGYRVIGVQPENAAYMHARFHGRDPAAVIETPTIADALSGPYEVGSVTEGILERVLEDLVLVSEQEILAALRTAWLEHGMAMEPGSAVSLAAARREPEGTERIAIISGGNVDPRLIASLA
jgi:threonine dehydratase